ncbi:MAG: tRNA(Ile)(2)-agmatinylcytidine synthase [Nitrososphaerales archaeon]
MPLLRIGFDDTDSSEGMCTTYLAYGIVGYLLERGAAFIDYPLLIRLNPNIPWKTRGNGAVALHVEVDDEERIIEEVRSLVQNNSHVGRGANPGLVFYSGEIPAVLKKFANIALYDVVSRNKAMEIAKKYGMQAYTFGNGQGIVGAMSAIGMVLKDHTFEIISYRKHENCDKLRELSVESVIAMAERTYPRTYNNYDYKHGRILITPRGPDPVFCGIRGEDPGILLKAFLMLHINEELAGYMIFRTNHGTNMHVMHEFDLSNLRTYTSGYVLGKVESVPYTMEGGHTFFTLKNEQGTALCAVYEPTGLPQLAQRLIQGDLIEIGGGVRRATSKHTKVINVEYIRILHTVPNFRYANPLCKKCAKRLKSDGRGKGYKCEKCGLKDHTAHKIAIEMPRDIKEGLYVPVPKAQRHLTKPLQRYGMEKSTYEDGLIPRWYCRFVSQNLILETN